MRWIVGDSTAMFTGLVQGVGVVGLVKPGPAGTRLEVETGTWPHRPNAGDSVSVQGCCLTAVGPFSGRLVFDVVHETLSKTNLGTMQPGTRVNLERSLAAGDLMGGHIVQGHVDGVGVVERVQEGPDWRVWLKPPRDMMKYMVPKGSVCLDGVSLTLAEVDPARGTIGVALIPTTLEVTTVREWRAGAKVNIEADSMAKTIVHYLEHFGRANGVGG